VLAKMDDLLGDEPPPTGRPPKPFTPPSSRPAGSRSTGPSRPGSRSSAISDGLIAAALSGKKLPQGARPQAPSAVAVEDDPHVQEVVSDLTTIEDTEAVDDGHDTGLIEWIDPSANGQELKPVALGLCTVCDGLVMSNVSHVMCSECSTVYHAKCWETNRGCGTYGCGQVNALGSRVAEQPAAPVAATEAPRKKKRLRDDSIPWDYLLLAISLLAALIGPFTRGVPSAAVAMLAILFIIVNWSRKRFRWVTAGVLAVSFVAAPAGYIGYAYLKDLGWIAL
jgi:hypothetical protein